MDYSTIMMLVTVWLFINMTSLIVILKKSRAYLTLVFDAVVGTVNLVLYFISHETCYVQWFLFFCFAQLMLVLIPIILDYFKQK